MLFRQEYFADYWALDSMLVSLELENHAACFAPSKSWESQARLGAVTLLSSSQAPQPTQRAYDRIVEGISAVLLTLKKRPVIRYSQTCDIRAQTLCVADTVSTAPRQHSA